MKEKQMSDSFILNLLLAFSGELQDAYTYYNRDGVFANAQTGNIVKFSLYLIEKDWAHFIEYLLPVLAFMGGVAVADYIHEKYRNNGNIHWRQVVLGYEVALLAISGFLPQSFNMIVNLMISFSCAMQVEAFRKIQGYGYASTMCIGNLRSGTEALTKWIRTKDPAKLTSTKYYFSVILVFAVGAGIGAKLSRIYGEPAIFVSVAVLALCLVMMQNWPETSDEAFDPMKYYRDEFES
jgi:uncharacterized membrane protein YoaK (UPF0700 family)